LEFETTSNVKMAQVVIMQGHPKIKRHRHIYLYYEWQRPTGEMRLDRAELRSEEAAATNR
jgi:hypothetical protein